MGTPPDPLQKRPIVLGVSSDQPTHVVLEAVRFAEQLGSELICAHVNPARFGTTEFPDGAMLSSPIDPDFADEDGGDFDPHLAAGLAEALAGRDVRWRTLALPGDVATALGHLADTVDAAMIVVGTQKRSLGGSIQEVFHHSIAANLARHQLRPVLVIPASRNDGADALRGRTEG